MNSSAPVRLYSGKTADQRRAERRVALTTAGLDIWVEQGWAAVTMRGVCARAGLIDRYFYESFADREELLATIWDQVRDETLVMLAGELAAHADLAPLDQLRAVQTAVVHHIADLPARAQILFGDHAGSAVLEQRRRDTIQRATDLMIETARPYLRRGIDEQAFRATVLIGVGGFVELMLAWRGGLIDADPDTIIDYLTAVAESLAPPFLPATAP